MEENPPESSIEHIKAKIKELAENNDTIDLSEYQYIFDSVNRIRKQTDAEYEIYIDVSINVLRNKQEEIYSETKHVLSNHYHIPVPSGQDHLVYLDSFLDHFQNCLSNSSNREAD